MSAQPRFDSAARVRLGFLGLGWIGRKRLDALAAHPQVEIAALSDNDAARLRSAAERYSQAEPVTDLTDLLARGLDGVVIATPNSMHAEQAMACLSAGVAVFCQKPLAINLADAGRVIAAAQAADRLLGIDYSYRHVQGMPELRRRILEGELGRITAIDLKFHNAYGPDKSWCYDRHLSGGGCVLDLGVHLVDLALWLQGEPPMQLHARSLFCAGRDVCSEPDSIEDFACAEFRQSNGALVRIACSWNAHAGADALIGFELFGTKGGAAWRNVSGSFYDFELYHFHGNAQEQLGTYPDDWGGRALQDWVRRLAADPSFDRDAWDIVQGARLIEAVYGR